MWIKALKIPGLIILSIAFSVLFSTFVCDPLMLLLIPLDKTSGFLDYGDVDPFPAYQVSSRKLFSEIEDPELVKNLDLSKSDFCDDDVSMLVSKFPNLVGLNLRETWIGDHALDNLLSLKDLRRLDLAFTHLTKSGLKKLSKFQNLENLSLGRSPEVCNHSPSSSDGVIRLNELRMLSLYFWDLASFKESSKKFSSLQLKRTDDSVACLEHFACKDSLKSLVFEDCHFEKNTIRKMLNCFPKLKELTVQNCLLDGNWKAFNDFPGELESLIWINNTRCNSSSLAVKEKVNPNQLKSLVLDDRSSVCSLENVRQLDSLTLFGCPDSELPFAGLTKLRHLSLNRRRLHDSDYKGISSLNQLESLCLNSCGLPFGSLKHLVNLNKLKSLELSHVELDSGDLVGLSKLANLKRLKFNNVKLPNQNLEFLDSLKNLEDLTIVKCGLTEACANKLKGMENLKHLQATGTVSDIKGLRKVCEIGGVEQILIRNGKQKYRWKLNKPYSKGIVLTDHLAAKSIRLDELLSDSSLLEEVYLGPINNFKLSQNDWKLLLQLKDLDVVDLDNGEDFDDQVFSLLDNCKTLERLRIKNSRISDKAAVILERSESITSLSLAGSGVTSKCLKHIGKLKNLRSLSLAQTNVGDDDLEKLAGINLIHLDLSQTNISNAALSALGKCKSLQTLNLYETNTSASGLVNLQKLSKLRVLWTGSNPAWNLDILALSELKNLEYLTISHSLLTSWGEKELQRKLPETKIRHSIYLVVQY